MDSQNPAVQGMMNNPEMMQRMQIAMMSDPELMALMTKPGIMEKFQQIMANPAAAQAIIMGDPDMLTLVTKMQSIMGGMGGGADGMGGMGAGFGAPAQAGTIRDVTQLAEFNQVIQGSGSKLVVVDYTMPGCGPCVRMAPVVKELAASYQGKVVFIKVDLSTGRPICMQQGVQAFPTFEFYRSGTLLEKFSGMNEARLRELCAQYGEEEKKRVPIVNPYKHFPLRSEEQVLYDKIKWESVVPGVEKQNAKLKESMFVPEQEKALSDREYEELLDLIETIKAKSSWHSSTISSRQYAIVDKMLQWPLESAGSGLHILRMLVLHPHASSTYSRRKADEAKQQFDVIKQVCLIAQKSTKPVNCLLAIRVLANFFSRRASAKLMMASHEDVFETLNVINAKMWKEASSPEAKSKDAATITMLNLSCVGIFINYAVLFAEDPSKYEEPKVVCLSNVIEYLQTQSKDPKILYRLLVVLGSLLYCDDTMTSTAADLEFPHVIAGIAKDFPKVSNLQEVTSELTQLFTKK
eukprot:gb/GEZN01005670.1/.p1 GENE.gb/GEZN01005670.1/~~gb/GEZN01005670.1/.p1  ORF type:complete len:522 (+),score=71.92 gb/GEZN01005670.1/:70-1635(+)